MTLDRDELARDFALALAQGYGFNEDVASRGVVLADALLAALASRPALAPPPAAAPVAYVPKVGDYVTWGACVCVYRVTNVAGQHVKMTPCDKRWSYASDDEVWCDPSLRPATPAEREAAGIPAAPVAAPVEAKRPTHVRVTGPSNVTHVTVGKVYKVTEWLAGEHPRPRIVNDDGDVWNLSTADECGGAYMPKWEPCAPPTPEAPDARGEAFKALLAYAECDHAYCYEKGGVWPDVFKRHGWDESENSGEWLKVLCARALALSRPAATKGGA